MTTIQKDLVKHLLKGCYLIATKNHHGNDGFKLYEGNMNPIVWYKYKTVKQILNYCKKDKAGKLTLNLSLVRKLHGKSLIKKEYNKSKV